MKLPTNLIFAAGLSAALVAGPALANPVVMDMVPSLQFKTVKTEPVTRFAVQPLALCTPLERAAKLSADQCGTLNRAELIKLVKQGQK